MTSVIIVKGVIVGIMWTFGWIVWFEHTCTEANPKTLSVVMAPWIAISLYFLIFWWG